MNDERYTALKKALQKIEKAVVQAHVKQARGPWKARVKALHQAAETGGSLDAFAKVLAQRSAVQFLLRTLYVRVLEDLGALRPVRVRGQAGLQAFREVAPALGVRAYLGWVFRDLGRDFPDLFAPRADELPLPSEALCQQVWDLWHEHDPKTQALTYRWAAPAAGGAPGQPFDSRFLGDLYQDLDADVRKRFALLQTPDFVEAYILDHTLTPALAAFDPAALRAKGERFRLIDPTCGSGHFLIGAFHRLADYWQQQGEDPWAACVSALDGVWGSDLNPHAVHIARIRLLLEVIARTGETDLARLRALPVHLRVMDALIPWEGAARGHQMNLDAQDRLAAYGDAAERAANRAFIGAGFHAVVGNPPYITPKDTQKRADYRTFWPDSATGKYGLAAPFVERLFTLGVPGGYMGQITGNAFMKRSFGRSLIETVLPRWDLTDIVDTSGAYIPGHGTPTVILFGRCQAPVKDTIRVLGGKRGEPKAPKVESEGRVWTAITAAGVEPTDEDAFITVSSYTRQTYSEHPWNVNGGGAPELQRDLADRHRKLAGKAKLIGFGGFTGTDDVFVLGELNAAMRVPPELTRPLVPGTSVRDYNIDESTAALVPYTEAGELVEKSSAPWVQHVWQAREVVLGVKTFGSKTRKTVGDAWWSWYRWQPERLAPPTITFAFVATHNHFVLDRGGKVFKQTAPVIKLPASASLADHLDLLGLLNSSTLGFWMKQVFFDKGFTGGGAFRGDDWEVFFEFDSTKLKQAPITATDRAARVALAEALDATAQQRAACLPAAVLAADGWTAATLADRLAQAAADYQAHTHRMVALQEELDWLTYHSYGLLPAVQVRTPAEIEPLAPGHRPFEILLARHNAACDPDERSAWFTRHGHAEVTAIPEHYSAATRALIQARLDLTEQHREIRLIEQPQFKRRWQLADLDKLTAQATRAWLLDRLEDLFAPGGPLAEPTPYRLERIALAWEKVEPRVRAVAQVYTGEPHPDLTLLAEQLLQAEGVPDNLFRVYSDEGLRKWRQWQEVWRQQDLEDAGHAVKISKPPEFGKKDFLEERVYKIRGKLNVPRERFIRFDDLRPARYGWNGWRDQQRALAQVDAFSAAEADPERPLPRPSTDDPRRCGATVGLWEALPDVKRWGDAADHGDLTSLAHEACGQTQCPCDIATAWREWRAGTRQVKAPDGAAPAVSLADRTRVFELVVKLQTQGQLSLTAEAGQLDLNTHPAKYSELQAQWPGSPATLARIVDELAASGHLRLKGKGSRRQVFVTRYDPPRSQEGN